jgi:hypothetical protein
MPIEIFKPPKAFSENRPDSFHFFYFKGKAGPPSRIVYQMLTDITFLPYGIPHRFLPTRCVTITVWGSHSKPTRTLPC